MKQTAIEWLLEQYENNFPLTFDAINKAKAMEKEQIIEAYNTSFRLRDKPYKTADKYYKETYESNT